MLPRMKKEGILSQKKKVRKQNKIKEKTEN